MAAKGCPVSSTRGAQVLPSHPRLTCGFTSRLLTCVVLVTLLTEEQTCVCVCSFKNKKKKNINTSTQWQQSCDYKVNAVPPVGLLESSAFFKLPRRIFTAPPHSHLYGGRAGMRVESYRDLLIRIFWSICRHAWYYCQAH